MFDFGSNVDKVLNVFRGLWGNDQSKKAELTTKCLNALYLSDPRIDRMQIIEVKGEGDTGSCGWILSNESYQEWSEGSDSKLLWLSGGPGKGKTTLSIFLTKELAKLLEDDQNTTLVYFFCDSENEEQKSALAILRSLIRQLLQQRPDLFKRILPKFQRAKETLVNDRDALWGILEKMVSSLKQCKTYCVLDGLDECDPDSLSFLVMKLKATVLFQENPSGGSLKLIVASRDTGDLRQLSLIGFPHKPSRSQRVDLDSPSFRDILETNIKRFILQETELLARADEYSPEQREYVKRTLTEGANGSLFWVAIVCRELRVGPPYKVEETLRGLPQGLGGAYRRMLDEVPSSRCNIVATILRWVALAARPLGLTELAIATNTPCGDAPSLEEAMRNHARYCGGLLEIDQDARVNFIHPSAKDYLLGQAPDSFRVEKAAVSLELAQICHSYIRDEAFRDGPIIFSRNDRRSEERLEQFPFLAYATIYWPVHLRDSESINIQLSQWEAARCRAWWETYCDATGDHFYHNRGITTLHVASYFGLTLLAKVILSDCRGGLSAYEQTALPWAARQGHQDIVELLLENGVDPDALEDSRTALSWVAQSGNKPLVEFLLKQEGVDVNSRSAWGNTPLSYAAWSGHGEVVSLFLSREGVDVNAADKQNRTPLSLAAENGGELVVGLLLGQKGVDVNWRDKQGRTPLSLAVNNGHEAVVGLLLGREKVDINSKDESDWTPLSIGARNGDEAMVRLLLGQKGVDANAKDGQNRTPLSLAAENGGDAVVRLLLDRQDVDINSKDGEGRTPLWLASINGHEEVVKLLLGRGMWVSDEIQPYP